MAGPKDKRGIVSYRSKGASGPVKVTTKQAAAARKVRKVKRMPKSQGTA